MNLDRWTKMFFLIVPLIFIILLINTPIKSQAGSSKGHLGMGNLSWKKWDPQLVEELKRSQTPTFIDFTAKWCFTCKINEKLVLETEEFKKLVDEHNLTLLLADWTHRDPIIGNWLQSQSVAGIPIYFVINSKGELINLGETISIDEIRKAIEEK